MDSTIGKLNEITIQLEREASYKRSKETEKIQAYYEGYIAGIEEICRRMEELEQSNME